MRNKFLGIVFILYALLILYIKYFININNFLAPSMQMYIIPSVILLFIIGLVLLFIKNDSNKLKISDILLILPFIFLFLAGDSKLSLSLAKNRSGSFNTNEVKEEKKYVINEKYKDLDFSSVDFEFSDEIYQSLSNYLTYDEDAQKHVGKKVRIRGFSLIDYNLFTTTTFGIGKYAITCCAADAEFNGLIINYDLSKIKNNTWYEIEGVLVKSKDSLSSDILAVDLVNIKEIESKEELYIYPCYAYGDGKCTALNKYNITNN